MQYLNVIVCILIPFLLLTLKRTLDRLKSIESEIILIKMHILKCKYCKVEVGDLI
jgi:hypothetical protein